jgi:peptidylprolyl isomerase
MLGLFLYLALSKPPDLTTPPPGNTRVLRAGTGKVHPGEDDLVKLGYVVWDLDGKVVDQSNEPRWTIVDLHNASQAWRDDILKMVVGEQRRTWMPAAKSVTDTELLEIYTRPATPSDVAAPPADATVLPSGLAYKVLRQGPGKKHPAEGDRVLVSYTGWTSEGDIYDSSVLRGQQTVELPVSGGIKGWVEGIKLMTSGTKMRFWMPPNLAYLGIPDKWNGPMVFDVELFIVSSELMPKRGQRRPGTNTPPPIPNLPPLPPGVH